MSTASLHWLSGKSTRVTTTARCQFEWFCIVQRKSRYVRCMTKERCSGASSTTKVNEALQKYSNKSLLKNVKNLNIDFDSELVMNERSPSQIHLDIELCCRATVITDNQCLSNCQS